MKPEQETVLTLIRAIVRGAHDITMKSEVCWAKVLRGASKQGVQGLCFDAIEQDRLRIAWKVI